MNIVRFKLWDYFKYARLLRFSLGSLCTNYFLKVICEDKDIMLWEIDYAANKEAYIKNITHVNYNRDFNGNNKINSEFNIDKFIYETKENEGTNLNIYGFTKKASNIIMSLDLKNFSKEESSDLEFRKFIKGQDEKLRCDIQNKIFHEENRIPLKPKDIVYECSRKAFLPNLSFFAVKNDEILGYGQILILKGKHTVANFGIVEEFRGKGYGEKLIVHILNKGKEMGLEEVYIKVKSDNIKALNLYKKMGFKEFSEVKIYELLS